MTMSSFGENKVRIFHPLIFGASCYVSCAPYEIEKSPLEVFLFVLEWILKKKTDDHVNTELAFFALGQMHCSTPISVPKLGFLKILPP
jgi:hypothetical protein